MTVYKHRKKYSSSSFIFFYIFYFMIGRFNVCIHTYMWSKANIHDRECIYSFCYVTNHLFILIYFLRLDCEFYLKMS